MIQDEFVTTDLWNLLNGTTKLGFPAIESDKVILKRSSNSNNPNMVTEMIMKIYPITSRILQFSSLHINGRFVESNPGDFFLIRVIVWDHFKLLKGRSKRTWWEKEVVITKSKLLDYFRKAYSFESILYPDLTPEKFKATPETFLFYLLSIHLIYKMPHEVCEAFYRSVEIPKGEIKFGIA